VNTDPKFLLNLPGIVELALEFVAIISVWGILFYRRRRRLGVPAQDTDKDALLTGVGVALALYAFLPMAGIYILIFGQSAMLVSYYSPVDRIFFNFFCADQPGIGCPVVVMIASIIVELVAGLIAVLVILLTTRRWESLAGFVAGVFARVMIAVAVYSVVLLVINR
jgi:hypothetical protein